jgi:hypothetical protein
MSEEKKQFNGPDLRYMEDLRHSEVNKRRSEIVNKIVNGVEKYQTHALWQKVIDSLARGADPLMIIEQLMDINIEQAEQLKKQIISEPVRYEITGEGAKELAKHMSGLKWQPVDPEKLPTGIVVAKDKNNDTLLGNLSTEDSTIVCICDDIELYNVTHYITIENLLKL